MAAGTRCYPALEPAMDVLAARGVKLAICTNKPERLTLSFSDAPADELGAGPVIDS